jgi:tetratricopeptide (TPR) repeat protein
MVVDRKQGMAAQYGNLGLVYRARGDLDAAEEMLKKALAIYEALGLKQRIASQYGNLGLIYRARGDLDAACASWRRALALFSEIGARPQVEQMKGRLRDADCAEEA